MAERRDYAVSLLGWNGDLSLSSELFLNCSIGLSAFDMVHDPQLALETLISLGFERVLTSGCDSSALEGLSLIKKLAEQVSAPYMPLGYYGHFLGTFFVITLMSVGKLLSTSAPHLWVVLDLTSQVPLG